jgi:hypothetical protein
LLFGENVHVTYSPSIRMLTMDLVEGLSVKDGAGRDLGIVVGDVHAGGTYCAHQPSCLLDYVVTAAAVSSKPRLASKIVMPRPCPRCCCLSPEPLKAL